MEAMRDDSTHWQQSERIPGAVAVDSLRVRRLFQAACLPRQRWWGAWWRKVSRFLTTK